MCVNLGVEAGGAQELLFSMGSESKEKTNIETKKSQLLLQHQKKMLFSHSESLKKIWRDLKLFKRANEFLSCGISHDMLRSMIFTVRANYHPKRKRCLVLLYHPNKHGEYARQKGINFFFSSPFALYLPASSLLLTTDGLLVITGCCLESNRGGEGVW